MADKYFQPKPDKDAFHCPSCRVYAHQSWGDIIVRPGSRQYQLDEAGVSRCGRCGDEAIWIGGRMVYPSSGTAPLPHPALPADIKPDFEEARGIASASPRGAAALLRLVIQKLCAHLNKPGENLNKDIGSLVEDGLPKRVQQALDVVRVIGNDAVHPGQIDLNDDPETAEALFKLVNVITEKMIAEPQEVEALFSSLPEDKKQQIEKRDSGSS